MPKRSKKAHKKTLQFINDYKRAKAKHAANEAREAERSRLAKAKRAKQTMPAHIPFESDETVLLIGEGDFSFARALVRDVYADEDDAKRIIATSFAPSPMDKVMAFVCSFTSSTISAFWIGLTRQHITALQLVHNSIKSFLNSGRRVN